jgi:hypothetical protein
LVDAEDLSMSEVGTIGQWILGLMQMTNLLLLQFCERISNRSVVSDVRRRPPSHKLRRAIHWPDLDEERSLKGLLK